MRPAAQLPPSMSDLAARQRGNLHLDDLHNHGLSTGALRGLEERGVLVPVAPRTWRCAGSPSTWEAEADGVLRHARAVALRPGRGGLGALIAATAPDAPAIFRSWLERYSAQMFAAAGLRGFRYNVEVRDDGQLVAILDVYWDEARLPVELDGMRVHAPANAAREDRRRTNRLRKLGISPLHSTYLDVLEEPERVLGEITQALRTAGY